MRMALRLAAKGLGRTSPNPAVGAVLVKNGEVIATGWHRKAGSPHAEAVALQRAGERAAGATLYVTLEPCSHTNKRTPPCSLAVIRSGVARVVAAMIDPNPQVSGGGLRHLKARGIDVTTGVLEAEARKQNEAFIKHITTGLPFVTLKAAQTLDGKIATASGESKWITGEPARRESHVLRNVNDAILVGINTVLSDDPSLTCRLPRGRDPVRVVVDSGLRIPLTAAVLSGPSAARTIIATLAGASKRKAARLQAAGAEVLIVRERGGRVDLRDLMKKLGRKEMNSVLIEGGSEINASALKAGVVDKAVFFVAPLIMTGADSRCSVGGRSPSRLAGAVRTRDLSVRFAGRDMIIEAYIDAT